MKVFLPVLLAALLSMEPGKISTLTLPPRSLPDCALTYFPKVPAPGFFQLLPV